MKCKALTQMASFPNELQVWHDSSPLKSPEFLPSFLNANMPGKKEACSRNESGFVIAQ